MEFFCDSTIQVLLTHFLFIDIGVRSPTPEHQSIYWSVCGFAKHMDSDTVLQQGKLTGNDIMMSLLHTDYAEKYSQKNSVLKGSYLFIHSLFQCWSSTSLLKQRWKGSNVDREEGSLSNTYVSG